MKVTQIKHRINPDPGSLIDSGGKKPLQNADLCAERINQINHSNPKTQSFSYRSLTIGLTVLGLMMVTSLIPSTSGLGLAHDVVRRLA
jgi:hypothetical protein